MADVVFMVPSPSGWLALDREALDRALAHGSQLMTAASSASTPTTVDTSAPALLTSEQMAQATGIPATWFERQARERRIPFRKLGRYPRFVLAEVLACEAFQRRAIPAGGVVSGVTGLHDRSASKK